jgi:murein DD-endopeptidase MepM/ murein hydrolase activator NlpD
LDNGFNTGVDIAVPAGTPVLAVIGGYVVHAGYRGGWGISVVVVDPSGYHHAYNHLSGVAVSAGDYIDPATVIGYSGNTGASTGPHLSYDVTDAAGNPVDPSPWLGIDVKGDNRK